MVVSLAVELGVRTGSSKFWLHLSGGERVIKFLYNPCRDHGIEEEENLNFKF
jgi:hypothetical protein